MSDLTGRCAEITATMAAERPDLRRVRGIYVCPIWGRREHWWLVDAENSIVDPTASQFPSGGLGEYEEHIEGTPEPSGLCLDCRSYVYGGRTFCCEACAASTRAFMESP